ncbi:metal-sulfur cluster assembly factor [Propionimicrobium lymphophilum]|uniref:MIP18 family-like domain-containing protein n=1 Tax=Propionimicrobium lymphophilum ACS-093-V-SCH5 TaxID=883161 RepID=S2W558_9ACTN|nr:hypothetical protein HMPREF9306_00940 [Propionimicrobium lymphophilum ACS-093-V-SCH5]ETJ98087.1 PF01883 domain protein [Propionimicrobium sp. BV2F7]
MSEDTRPSDLVKDDLPDAPGKTWAEATQAEKETVLYEALKDVVDPELMVNIVDLGLVYGVDIDDDLNVTVDMTLTSPACPLTDYLEAGCQQALSGLAKSVTVNWVWMPPWTLEMVTEDGREQLRAIGFMI